MEQHTEHTMELRGTQMRGLVLAVNDTGPMQTVDVQTHDGMIRQAIEVYQPFGIAMSAPAVGSVVQLAAFGGDPGDMVALPAICPAVRYGGLAAGECVLYDATGDRVALRQGGTIQILGATTIELIVQGVSITQTSAGIAIVGNVSVQGGITTTADVVAGTVSLQHHVNTAVQPGGGNSGPPAA